MELRQYTLLLWRWLWLILIGAVVAGSVAYYVSHNQTPIYEATSTLLVSEGGTNYNNDFTSLLTSERLAKSFAERLTNHDVLMQAISNLGLDMSPAVLEGSVDVSLVTDTQLIALSVESSDPEVASNLANEIPKVFAERNLAQQLERFTSVKASLESELTELEAELIKAESTLETEIKKENPDQTAISQANENLLRLRETHSRVLRSLEDIHLAEVNNLTNIIIDEFARPPRTPIKPRVMANTFIAAATGALLAMGIVFLIEYLDDTVKSPQEIEKGTGLTTLGNIRMMKKVESPADALVVSMEPRSPSAEAYRQIRTNIQFASVDRQIKTLLVTSANIGEGKSTVAANLSIALSQSGKRVILVDTDMRRPTLHRLLEVDGSKGLSNLIVRGREDSQIIKNTLIPNLSLIPSGRLPPNPAELLGSERMKEVVKWLQQQADYVVFDSPPLLAVTDAAVLSHLVDTTIIVVSSADTRYPAFTTAIKQIESLGSHIAGVILNKVPHSKNNGYYYYYYHQSSYEPEAIKNVNGQNGYHSSTIRRRRSKGRSLTQIFDRFS